MSKSLERGLKILELIASKKHSTVTELAAELDVNKSTAFRLLETLLINNYVEKDPKTFEYSLGVGVLNLSMSILNNIDIINIARPIIKKLMEETNETVHLCQYRNGQVVVIDQVMSKAIMKVTTNIGFEEPFYASAVGKTILAYMDEKKRNEALKKLEYKNYTGKTISSEKELLYELDKVISLGYAVDDEEMNEGVRCIGAPVENNKGWVEYSIGISAPSSRLNDNNMDEYAAKLKRAAEELSKKMGYAQ